FEKMKNTKTKKLSPLVILSDKLIKDDNIRTVIRHELYHYIDYLIGNDDYRSKSLDIDNYLVYDETKYYMRISMILFGEIKEMYSYEEVISVNYVADIYLNNITYFCSHEELFVRYHGMKKRMVELSIIENINDNITIDNVMELINKDNILKK